MLDRREIVGYVIVHSDGDRPYYCHRIPDEYVAKRGSRVFRFVLPLPDEPNSRLGIGIIEVDITQAKALADIADERVRQDRKFPKDYMEPALGRRTTRPHARRRRGRGRSNRRDREHDEAQESRTVSARPAALLSL